LVDNDGLFHCDYNSGVASDWFCLSGSHNDTTEQGTKINKATRQFKIKFVDSL
jgi:hypothetical protein